MTERLIRVRDFADNCGCTPQNIYLHLKNYAQELEGHTIQGKGRQGILLDEYAQEFLRSIMYPKELTDSAVAQEIEQLRKALALASQENARLLARALSAEAERDKALLDAGENQRLLMASQRAQEAQSEELRQAKTDVAAMSDRADRLDRTLGKVQDERDAAERDNKRLEDENHLLRQEVEQLRKHPLKCFVKDLFGRRGGNGKGSD